MWQRSWERLPTELKHNKIFPILMTFGKAIACNATTDERNKTAKRATRTGNHYLPVQRFCPRTGKSNQGNADFLNLPFTKDCYML